MQGKPSELVARLQRRLRRALAGIAHERLVVAFSGGPDSTLLLHLAVQVATVRAAAGSGAAAPPGVRMGAGDEAAISPGLTAAVAALHVNHGLHPDADLWQDHCAAVCAGLGVQFLCRKVAVAGGNLEAAARRVRYQAFDELLGPGDLLLLGHHRDDQAETLLLRMLQGRGVAGMPGSRRLAGGALILRPFLAVSRSEILAAAEELGADFLNDPSNAEPALDRNFLRLEVLPLLTKRWPGAAEALVAAGESARTKDVLLGRLLDADGLSLKALPTDLHVPALRAWLARFAEQGASNRALAAFAAQLGARPDAQPELRLRRGSLRRWRGAVHYAPVPPLLKPCYAVQPPCVLSLPHGQLSIERVPAGGFQAAAGRLQVRFRRGGERIRANGHLRTLKAVFHAAAVPPWRRAVHPLVFCGDELLAVPGIAMADALGGQPRWRALWVPKRT